MDEFGSKWKCKVGTCVVTYCAKWLLTKHFKEVHGLVVEKAKLRKFSTFRGGLWHQDHAKMNVRILGNAMAMQRWNDQKVVNCTCAKAQQEWDKLVIIVKQYPPFPKPTLIKLALEQLLKCWVSMLGMWEACFEMQHHRWRRMKIYKRWFDPPIVYMHNDWRWHEMSKIRIESQVK